MAFNLELIDALLKEQEEALSTVHRCQRQIARLVKEQIQCQSLKQSTEHQAGEHSTGQGKKQKQDPTPQAEELSDEDLIQALQLHEWRNGAQSPHSTSRQELMHEPSHQPQMAPHNATMEDQPQDTVGRQQLSTAAHSMATAPELPIAGLRAFHICPAMHIDGSGKCLMLLPYPCTAHAHCPCGHSQAAGTWILVELWLAGIQHVCTANVPSTVFYQRTAQQLGEQAPYTKRMAQRLAFATASSTAMRSTRHNYANFDIFVCRNGNWCMHSEAVFQSLAHLTWDEIVLAHSKALRGPATWCEHR